METITNYASQGNSRYVVYETIGKNNQPTYTTALILGAENTPISHDTFPNLTLALRKAGISAPVDGVVRYLGGEPLK